MKKILFAALAVLAITSCSQNEEIEAPTQKTEINFRSVVGKSSRAAEATTENLDPKVSYFTPIILKQLQWTK